MSTMILTETAYEASNDFTLSVDAYNSSGIAPLGVSFDLTNSIFGHEDILMLAEFMWDFGDDGTSNGTGTDDPYNIGKGFAVSHVYRTAGTYTATCTGYFKNIVKTITQEVVVSEFDDITGSVTYYVSADGSDSNNGLTTTTPFATPAYALENFLTENTKFLFRQGDTFSFDSIVIGEHGGDDIVGPVILDSYEDTSTGLTDKPIFYSTVTTSSTTSALSLLNCSYFRIIGIKIMSGGSTVLDSSDYQYPSGFALSSTSTSDYMMFLDCEVSTVGSIAFAVHGSHNIVQDCSVTNCGSYGIYSASFKYSAVIGNYVAEFNPDGDSNEYCMRLTAGVQYSYVAYNDIRGDYVKLNFTLRGAGGSNYNYVWNNQFDRAAGFNPTNDEEEEYIDHNTFDSNMLIARDYSGNNDDNYKGYGFFCMSCNTMLRNNIISGYAQPLWIDEHPLVGGVDKVWVYNNTILADGSNKRFAEIYKKATNIKFKNNIFYNSYTEGTSYTDAFLYIQSVDSDELASLTQIDSDYNMFYGESWGEETSFDAFKISYEDNMNLSEWSADTSNETNSIYASADLISTTIDEDDFNGSLDDGYCELSTTSPAIGVSLPPYLTGRFDFNNNKRLSNDMGAICSEVE